MQGACKGAYPAVIALGRPHAVVGGLVPAIRPVLQAVPDVHSDAPLQQTPLSDPGCMAVRLGHQI